MLDIKGVKKSYGEFQLDCSLNVEKGRITGLVGENGAGKTTLLKCMAGIYRPEGGSITYDGKPVYDNEKMLERVAFISDSQEFFSIYTAKGLLRFYQKCYPDFQMDQFMKLNQKFDIDLKKGIGAMSKGQKMRFSFMLAIARRPDYILMDEPTDGLDAGSRKYLKDILMEETEKRELGVVLSSHDLNGMEMLCDEVSFMKRGRIQIHSDMDDVIEGGFTAEYYREENPHEVLMVGDCELYENFSPVTMWKNYGITSYIRGSAQQLTWQSYYLLEDALKYETPDVVVFNVLELKYNEPQREEYNRMTLDGMRWSVSKVQAIRASMLPEEHFIDYVFPLLRYHSRVTELTANDWKYYFKDKTRTTAGYYMRVDTAPYEEGIWEEEEPESDTLGKNAMAYLDKIRMLCEKNHIRLLLVKAPSKSPVWYDTWESQILEYASKYDLDYINFLNLVDEIGIDYNTDTYDQGLHMNLSGAEKCADYLGKFLSETYGLKDLRSDKTIYSDWENKTIFYENMKKAQYKELKKYGEIVNY